MTSADRGVTAIVLCGGRSSRFGSDKALHEIDDRSLLSRAINTCRSVAAEVLLASGAERRYADFGYPMVLDELPGRGPLAGISAGLEKAQHDRFVVLAVDLPFVTSDFLEELLEYLDHGASIVMPRTERGLEPLCAAGYRRPCLPVIRSLLAGERPAVQDLLGLVGGHEYAVGPDHPRRAELRNVNTSADLMDIGNVKHERRLP
jgi:molybdenum cofactor guanylyltransferase